MSSKSDAYDLADFNFSGVRLNGSILIVLNTFLGFSSLHFVGEITSVGWNSPKSVTTWAF